MRGDLRVGVVGGGIVGLCTAWSLVKLGHRVALYERASSVPNPLAASGDHTRMIRHAYGTADGYARMMPEAEMAWAELWRDIGRSHYSETGIMIISQAPGDEGEAMRAGLERMCAPHRVLLPDVAAARYPYLQRDSFRYAVLSAQGGVLMCRRIAHDIAWWLRENGAAIETASCVTDIDQEVARVKLANGTSQRFDCLVVAAGAWTLRLLPELRSLLTNHRNAVAYLEPPADLVAAWASAPAIAELGGQAGAYVFPPQDGSDLKIGVGAHKRASPDPDARRSPEKGEGEALLRHVSPPLARIGEYRVREVATCAYTFTIDNRFLAILLGRTLVVSACSGHGYKFGAAVGRRAAAAVRTGDVLSLSAWLRAEGVGVPA